MVEEGTPATKPPRFPERPGWRAYLAVARLAAGAILEGMLLPFHAAAFLFRRKKIKHDLYRLITGERERKDPPDAV